jgi:hypothetical protein
MKYLLAIAIVLFSCNVSAAAREEERGIRVGGTGAEEVRIYKESYALVIGVSDYRKDWPDLPGVKQDVQAVRGALEDHGFKVVSVADPTRRQLEDQFNGFISAHGQDPDNRLLFYFAGHGHTLKLAYGGEMGYIVPADAPSPERDRQGFLATAMDMQMIEVYARRVQAKHAFFLFDSCFSGSIFSLSRAIPENISYKTTLPVRQFVTSGSADEQVPDQSVFRRQFIAALDGEGDLNDDGYVTGAELGEFLQNKVVNYSRGSQHPQYGKIRDPHLDKGDFVFLLPKATSPRQPAAVSAPSPALAGDPEKEMWDLVKNSEVDSDLEAFLAAYPRGRFAGAAKLKAQQLQRKQPATTAAAPAPAPQPKGGLATKAPALLPLAERYPNIATANTSAYLGNNRWDWTVFVDADPQTLGQISCVEYTLHETFPDPVRTSCSRENKFALSSNGWGVFQIKVRVLFHDKSERHLSHMLTFR